MKLLGRARLLGTAAVAWTLAAAEPAPSAHTNRLSGERSPYLLQHAHNPVDWNPWGEEAFARARRENKPIFLSIGYSTCHWCHVMASESFENPAIAALLNTNFVCIKVDREERPDVDHTYMAYVQAATGSGGWPLNVWLTPDLKPFFGGTYYPPDDRFGLTAFPRVVQRIANAWASDRGRLTKLGENYFEAKRAEARQSPKLETPGAEIPAAGLAEMASAFDSRRGGFSKAPKFPQASVLRFLLTHAAREGTNSKAGKQALEMATVTLRRMAEGGIHDQLGGGFHRYSVDPQWHVPHFEKMLYDQAQLARVYLDAFQLTRDPLFAETARGILDYVRRDLADPAGGFCTAEDADSLLEAGKPAHGEGAFYVWTAAELERLLGAPSAEMFGFQYGVKAKGNAPDGSDPHREFGGKNILVRAESVESTAKRFGLPVAEVAAKSAEARRTLFQARAQRPRPSRDDKVITAWNGLMISALARGSQVLDDPAYVEAATRAALFLKDNLRDPADGGLLRGYRQGAGTVKGFADDHAFLIQGLLDLYEASFEIRWLRWAAELQERQDALFWDDRDGGYFGTRAGDSTVLVRTKEEFDGAEPAPNSVSALNLLRLAQMTGNPAWREHAEKTLRSVSKALKEAPSGLPQMLVALELQLARPRQVVIAGKPGAADTQALLRVVHRRFQPDRILLLADGADGQEFLASRQEFIRSMKPIAGRAAAYVCENFVCQMPTDDPAVLDRILAVGGDGPRK
jgi:uncharacterized protein